MMWEEATKRLKGLKARCERLIVSSDRKPEEWRKDAEALGLALSALRPVSRERVEKAWKGEWEKSIENGAEMYRCSRCGARDVKELYEYENPRRFCYHCGAPMTDEAVQMVMKRLEALHGDL